MYADCEGEMYVRLCEGDMECPEDRGKCGRWVKAVYGTRPAALSWQKEYTKRLKDAGFSVGKSSHCIFHNAARDIWVFVHGDDFVASGVPTEISWFRKLLESHYQIKSTTLGEARGCKKEARVLNRILKWHDGIGLTYEADPGTRRPSYRPVGWRGRSLLLPQV